MRVDKATPSSSLTLTKFIARNLPKSMQKQTHHRDRKTMAVADSDDDANVASAGAAGGAAAVGEELNAFA
jgi:hypothetical protein